MNNTVFCKSTGHDVQSFYLRSGSTNYYLFTQNYKQSVHDYFAGGVNITNALSSPSGRKDTAINKTMEKLPKYITYIEKEFGLAVLEKTKRKNSLKTRCA